MSPYDERTPRVSSPDVERASAASAGEPLPDAAILYGFILTLPPETARPAVRALLAPGPFEDHAPRAIRARYYRYEFTRLGQPTRAWWKRTLVGEYLPPLVRDDLRAMNP